MTETGLLSLTLYKTQLQIDQRPYCKTFITGKKKRTGKTLEFSNYFLNRTQIAQETRARIDRWDCIKLKSFCTLKETVSRM
jgi:hypothetical protein